MTLNLTPEQQDAIIDAIDRALEQVKDIEDWYPETAARTAEIVRQWATICEMLNRPTIAADCASIAESLEEAL